MNDSDIGAALQKALGRLTVATVILFLVLVGLGVWVYIDSANKRADLAEVATTTNAALCALRYDIEQRAASSADYLREHPNGLPGIPASIIKQNLAGQRRTIEALSGLACGKEQKP